MGMYLSVIRVSGDQLNAFRLHSKLLEDLLNNEATFDAKEWLDLDKSWDGIQYLLTGKGVADFQSPPTVLGRAIFSEQLLDPDQDLGYGPAHFLNPEQVKETAKALISQNPLEMIGKADPKEMERMAVYPGFWTQEGTMEYLQDGLIALCAFYMTAAEQNEAIISFLT